MAYEQLKVSAPGSVMLFGEHAVLHGSTAIVGAIDQRISLTFSPRVDRQLSIVSAELGTLTASLDRIDIQPPFHFLLAVFQSFQSQLKTGFDVTVESDCRSQLGFGTSAAVTAAAVAGLLRWHNLSDEKEEIFLRAKNVIQQVQGCGSGADVLASVYGGLSAYGMDPFWHEPFDRIPQIHLIYSGYKMPTTKVIAHVEEIFKPFPQVKDTLFETINTITLAAINALKENDWGRVGKLMQIHYSIQQALQVSDQTLDEIVEYLSKQKNIFGQKISGSGLGDCVIALGNLPANFFPVNEEQKQKGIKQYDVRITPVGVSVHEALELKPA